MTFVANPDGSVTFTSADGTTSQTIQPDTDTDTFGTLVANADGSHTWTPAGGGTAIVIPADTDTDTDLSLIHI